MKNNLLTILTLLLAASIMGCQDKMEGVHTFTHLNDTLTIEHSEPSSKFVQAANEVFKERIDLLYAPSGYVAKINQTRSDVEVDGEFANLLRNLISISEMTERAYTPLMGKMIELWGINDPEPRIADYDLLMQAVVDIAESQLIISDDNKVTVSGSANLDLGMAGIGWALDGVASIMQNSGVKSAKVHCKGIYRIWIDKEENKKWSVDMIKPFPDDDIGYQLFPQAGGTCIIEVEQLTFQYGTQKYHHIINPTTGFPTSDVHTVLYWAPTSSEAAALAYAAIVLGRSETFSMTEEHPQYAIFMVYEGTFGIAAEFDSQVMKWLRMEVVK